MGVAWTGNHAEETWRNCPMKAIVDADTCIGCELCVGICPEVFRMETGKAVVYVAQIPKEVYETCKKAAEECPVDAITVE